MPEMEPNHHRSVAQSTAVLSYSVVFMATQPCSVAPHSRAPGDLRTSGAFLNPRHARDGTKPPSQCCTIDCGSFVLRGLHGNATVLGCASLKGPRRPPNVGGFSWAGRRSRHDDPQPRPMLYRLVPLGAWRPSRT